jgi:hypothetical protein
MIQITKSNANQGEGDNCAYVDVQIISIKYYVQTKDKGRRSLPFLFSQLVVASVTKQCNI